MILIRKPSICVNSGKARLSAILESGGQEYTLWYEVEERFGDYLCADLGDPWVVAIFKEAFVSGQDIVSEAPLSAELVRGVQEVFIPAIVAANPDLKRITIKADLIESPRFGAKGVGCGLSCGVDSLYTLLSHRDVMTHLVVNNYQQTKIEDLASHGQIVADEVGLPLIVGDTNYHGGSLPGTVFHEHSTHANLFAAYCLRKGLSRYYLSTGYSINDTAYAPYRHMDMAHYDILFALTFSSDSLKVIPDGMVGRLDKVRMLATEPLAQHHLDVCWRGRGKTALNGTFDCPKCMRTVLELMAVGQDALDRFGDVFDLGYVRTHREEYLAELIRDYLHGTASAVEVWPLRKRLGFTIKDWLLALLIVARKLLKKALRGGVSWYDVFAERIMVEVYQSRNAYRRSYA